MDVFNSVPNPIIVFDGVCNLCCGAVQFLIRRDKKKVFRYASIQTEAGKAILNQAGFSSTPMNTLVLLEGEKIYTASTAILKIIKKLASPWPLLYAFILIPPFIRNGLYRIIANSRYHWFGRKKECWLPNKEIAKLFIS